MRIVKDIKTKYFYALKIMKKARIVRMKQIGKHMHGVLLMIVSRIIVYFPL